MHSALFSIKDIFFATSVRFIHKHFDSLYTILNGIFNFKLFTGLYTNTLDLDIVLCCNLTKLTYSSSSFVDFLEYEKANFISSFQPGCIFFFMI